MNVRIFHKFGMYNKNKHTSVFIQPLAIIKKKINQIYHETPHIFKFYLSCSFCFL